MCEEFGCLPGAARHELDTDPDRMVLVIMDMRAFERTRAAVESHQDVDRPRGPMAARVMAAIESRIATRRARDADPEE